MNREQIHNATLAAWLEKRLAKSLAMDRDNHTRLVSLLKELRK